MRIQKRRRREGKTDYKARIALLKAAMPRIVVRKTNRYIIAQYVKSIEARDKVVLGVNSKNLLKFGWPEEKKGSLKSLPAGYLTGFLLGKKILEKSEKKAIFDIGLIRNVKGSRVYAVLAGLIDSGIDITCKKEILPSKERITGKDIRIKNIFESIKKNINSGVENEEN